MCFHRLGGFLLIQLKLHVGFCCYTNTECNHTACLNALETGLVFCNEIWEGRQHGLVTLLIVIEFCFTASEMDEGEEMRLHV